MRKLVRPTIRTKDIVECCISNMKNESLKNEIISNKHKFDTAEDEFVQNIFLHTLHNLPQDISISRDVQTEELTKLYTRRMSSKNNPARKYYDFIIAQAPGGRCPLCGQRIVTTLDHYLPKSKFPILSVTPCNLIPACSDCNKSKLNVVPRNGEEETLHPYFDDIEEIDWLKMEIIQVKPMMFKISVNDKCVKDKRLVSRIKFHMKSLSIDDLYVIHAVEEFDNIRTQLKVLYNRTSSDDLRKQLREHYESRYAVNRNSWQTALYRCLYKNVELVIDEMG
jgi:5-methylcytosine-specific restriction endonuclease McrA